MKRIKALFKLTCISALFLWGTGINQLAAQDTITLECELTTDVNTQSSQNIRNAPYPHPNSNAFKRNRQSEAIDLRSPNYGNKRQEFKLDHKEDRHSYNAQGQG